MPDEKILLVAFQGELMCFVHVLLNALDMHDQGKTARIVFEGMSVRLVAELEKEDNPFQTLYARAKAEGLIEGACNACSTKLGVSDDVRSAGIDLIGDMLGHPSLGDYMDQGYTVLTF